MNYNQPAWTTVDKRLNAEPTLLDGRMVEYVAQMSGRLWSGGGTGTVMTGALIRIRPVAIVVHNGGETRSIQIGDSAHAASREIIVAAGMVSVFCVLIMLAARILTRWR